MDVLLVDVVVLESAEVIEDMEEDIKSPAFKVLNSIHHSLLYISDDFNKYLKKKRTEFYSAPFFFLGRYV